jgi:hypothetical protein
MAGADPPRIRGGSATSGAGDRAVEIMSDGVRHVQRLEAKYRTRYRDLVGSLLRAHCVEEAPYAENYVFSIYFDTFDLRAYREKRDGALHKTKLRARWYADSARLEIPPRVKIEVKQRHHGDSVKRTVESRLPRADWADLLSVAFWRVPLAEVSGSLPEAASGLIAPVIVCCYRRARFYDPLSGCRLSLDDRITALGLAPWLVPCRALPVALPESILEVKGGVRWPHPALRRSTVLLERSFSKYAALLGRCLDDDR